VEREHKRDGEYKEERKCKGGPRGYEQKQKYREGSCLIEREWSATGNSKRRSSASAGERLAVRNAAAD
jgi:hypothetical protein